MVCVEEVIEDDENKINTMQLIRPKKRLARHRTNVTFTTTNVFNLKMINDNSATNDEIDVATYIECRDEVSWQLHSTLPQRRGNCVFG